VGARPTSTGQTVAHLVDNGKRVLDIDLREWAYARPYLSSAQREAALQPFLHRYNWHRPHSALNHLPPISRIPAMSNLLELNS
jgi:transposase InsO family protein